MTNYIKILLWLLCLLTTLFLSNSCFFHSQLFSRSDFRNSKFIQSNSIKVNTKAEFLAALTAEREYIYIDENAIIDLSNEGTIELSANTYIRSDYSLTNRQGALLFSNSLETCPLFISTGNNITIEGLRIIGPDSLRRTETMIALGKQGKYYSIPNSRGIQIEHENVNVLSCEISAWSHAGIFVRRGGTAIIERSYIHHNQRQGLGYGISLDNGRAFVNLNNFDWNRHHIAGTGVEGTSYEFCNNIIGENANGHAVDMHGGRDRKDGTTIAGDYIYIYNNTFLLESHPPIKIRGRPQNECIIYDNTWKVNPTVLDIQSGKEGNVQLRDNYYMTSKIAY